MPALKFSSSSSKFKVLLVGAEAAPYATVGGFSMVLAYLSRALVKKGHDVRLFIPKFGSIDEEKYGIETLYTGLEVPTGDEATPYLICNIKYTDGKSVGGVPTYFLENQEYYEKRANVYGYVDDPTRWALLSRGILEFIRTKQFVPDIIHANDWHTGLVSNYLETVYAKDPILSDIATVLTIHNIMWQGAFDHHNVPELEYDDGRSEIASFFDPRLKQLNFLKRGILHSNAINTVSQTYSREILTSEFGEGLDKLLIEVRSKLFGIVNGLDYKEFDPATDNLIAQNYDIGSLRLRSLNRKALQNEYDLPVNEDALIIGFVGRLDWQKGIDLAVNTLKHALKDYNIQFVQVGGGDGGITNMLQELQRNFPDKVGVHTHSNFTLSHLLFAGCDCIVYPSRFEPCGVVQIEAMRYGAVPIVRKVGGLADTVENFDSIKGTGTGLVFTDFNEFSLFGQIARAVELKNNAKVWRKIQINAMNADFSWDYSAKEYERLYDRAQSFRAKEDIASNKMTIDEITFPLI